MAKESFKIGDKIRLKNPKQFRCGTKVLTVAKEAGEDNNKFIHVTYEGLRWGYFPLYPHEVELAVKVDEQLEFDFMKGK